MKSKDLTISEIKVVVDRILPETRVLLFGSRARGDERSDSDYDLLVIVKKSLDNQQRLYFQARVRKALADQNILADILIQSESQVEQNRRLPGHIVRTALREGVSV